MPKLDTYIGLKKSRLTVIEVLPAKSGYSKRLRCQCECGGWIVAEAGNVIRGRTKSCGCLITELRSVGANHRHGEYGTPVYKTWIHFVSRCTNPKDKQYENYGGRGITVCDDWLEAKNFLAWARGKWKRGLQIDRVDNDEGYSPDNCRFVTAETNSNNRRVYKNNELGITGVRKCKGKYQSYVSSKRQPFNGLVHLGFHNTIEEALAARNEFITENNLPHRIQKLMEIENA